MCLRYVMKVASTFKIYIYILYCYIGKISKISKINSES